MTLFTGADKVLELVVKVPVQDGIDPTDPV